MAVGRRFVRFGTTLALGALLPLASAGCRDEPTSGRRPSAVELASLGVSAAVAGSTLTPTFTVRDADGAVLVGVPVRVTVTAGGGSVRNAATTTVPGVTPAGEWTLGTATGRNTLGVVVGGLTAAEISVDAIPDAPAGISVTGGGQFAPAGEFLREHFVLKVHDRFGNGIPGATVRLTVEQGGGDVAPTQVVTDALGRSEGVWWRLGRRGGEQRVVARAGPVEATISAGIQSEYNPQVRFFGPPVAEEVRGLFTGAAERIRAAVVGDVPDVALANFDAARCGVSGIVLNEVVDDVVVFASVTEIDGKGRILASAGPCLARSLSGFVVVGVMRFDSDDVGTLLADGRLGEVILHELLHVVGIGTLWRSSGLITGSGTSDPRFRGALASAACVRGGGAAQCGSAGVPLENSGGPGTIEVHWRETTFDSELMTGFAEAQPGMPFSEVTIFSLADLGLQVNGFAADPFTLPPPAPPTSPRLGAALLPPWEEVEGPRFEVTPGGWVRPLRVR